MSNVVSLKSPSESPKPKADKASQKSEANALQRTVRPQELVLRPSPLRRYFE